MAMTSPQVAHAQRCEVYLRVLSVLNGPLSMCQTGGALQLPLHHPPAFVALNRLPCFRAVCCELCEVQSSWTWQMQSWFLLLWLWPHLKQHMRKGVVVVCA
jgi:hypothetical protein